MDTMAGWRKTARCETAACVEVNTRVEASAVLMRDSKDPDGVVLEFSRDEWRDFCTAHRAVVELETLAVDVMRSVDGNVVVARADALDRALEFTAAEWDTFEAGVRDGEFDNLAPAECS